MHRCTGTADWNEAGPADPAAADVSRLNEIIAEFEAAESTELELAGNERLAELVDIERGQWRTS
jgi:hypothetical protein